MAIAGRVKQFLRDVRVHYELLPRSPAALPTAVAKPLLFRDRHGRFFMAVVPADRKLDVSQLCKELHCELEPVDEHAVRQLFPDCARGPIPPVGQVYGVEVICDDSLLESPEVYFETGDPPRLVHVSGADFRRLMASMEHTRLSQAPR